MCDFTIYVDNIYSKIEPRPPTKILRELIDVLSYKVLGAEHSFRYQQGLWDGRVRLFYKNGKFYTGMMSIVTDILNNHGKTFKYVDNRIKPKKEKSIPLQTITLRPYQKRAVKNSIIQQRGIIKIPSGGGKTEIMAGILAKLNLPACVFVHRKELMYQAQKRIAKRLDCDIGIVGCGEVNIKKITVVMMQTAINAIAYCKHKKKIKKNIYMDDDKETRGNDLKKIYNKIIDVDLFMVDECFPGHVKVMLDENNYMSIKDVVKNSQVTQVLSYNEKIKKVELKNITRKIKIKKQRKLWHLEFYINGKRQTLNCTYNHKIWTQEGYKQAKDIVPGDIIKYYGTFNQAKRKTVCEYCGLSSNNGSQIGGHKKKHLDLTESIKRTLFKREQNGKWRKSLKEMGKCRREKNNPVNKYPGTKQKISKSRKAAFDALPEHKKQEQIIRFRNAPKYRGKMTKPEKAINDLKIPNLIYTGNGKYKDTPYTYLIDDPKIKGRQRRKIPDFVLKGTNKVIEVVDREYWHTEKELNNLIKNYAKINIKCLVIYADKIKNNFDEVKAQLKTFIYNHDAIITESKGQRYAQTVYNLEVEDNHNYFADGVLVSNCHHIATDTAQEINKTCKKAFYRFGFSATPYRDDNADLLIMGLFGKRSADITASELIKKGYLVPPKIYLLNFKHDKSLRYVNYQELYKLCVTENLQRNMEIVKAAIALIEADKTVLIAVNHVEHGKNLMQIFDKYTQGIRVAFAHGSKEQKERDKILDKLGKRKLDCVISTSIFGEGIDIPSLDALIIAKAQKSKVDSLQLVGRVLRLNEETNKKEGIVIDIQDKNIRYLKNHSKDIF